MGLFSVVGAGLVGLASWGIPKLIENWIKNNKKQAEELQKERELKKQSALSFLGKDTDGYSGDDASDVQIPFSPVEVLDGIAGGLLPGSTVVPDLESSQVISTTISDIIQEIQRINRNIEAIHGAMLASAVIESDYRQEVIADLEQAIADKDKARSQRRAGRRRDRVDDRRPKPKKKIFGSVGERFKQMGIISSVFILSEVIAKVRKEGFGWLTGGDKNGKKEGEAGGIFTGPDSGYNVTLHGTELVLPLNNRVTDGISGNEFTSNGSAVSNIFKNESSSFALNNKSNIFSSSPTSSVSSFNSKISSIINSSNSTTMPVGDDQGSFTVIDMRTAQKLVSPNEGNASVTGSNEVITLSPERRMSPYEPFVTHHV